MKHMSEVGIRALKQNASAVVSEAAAGKTVVITDRNRPVAQLTAISPSRIQQLLDAGEARPPKRHLADLGVPARGPSLSEHLRSLREEAAR